MWLIWIGLCVSILALLIFYFLQTSRRDGEYFEKKGVVYLGNGLYNIFANISAKKNFFQMIWDNYEKVKRSQSKVGGSVDFGKKTYMTTNLNHFKHILVKDFDHFVNRRQFGLQESDILIESMLVFMTDEKWKQLRSKLSPTFTTGKIKRMFPLFNRSGEKMVKFIASEMRNSQGEIDITEAYSKFTMDVIANAVCGIDSHAFNQKESSVFEKMGNKLQDAFNFKLTRLIEITILVAFPKLAKSLGISMFGSEVRDFFTHTIKTVINRRRETGEKRDDFIQLMIEAKAGTLKTDENELEDFEKDAQIKLAGDSNINLLDDNGIVSSCVVFVVGGFDTTQSLLLFFAYALALHPEIQEKLQAEVDAAFENTNGKLTYDAISNMTYLDMITNETLRMYPPTPAVDRECTKAYKLPGTEIVIEKGEGVLLPIIGLHHDEEFWENPTVFNPERFSHENKHKINQYAFAPFGHGPRNCIGMRFALMEVKVALSHIVRKFSIHPSQKTNIPMKYDTANSLKPLGGMWLAFHRRQ